MKNPHLLEISLKMLPDSLIHISDEAAVFINNLFLSNSIPANYFFRITASGSLGEVIEYKFGFDSAPRTDDTIIELSSFKIIIDPDSLFNIEGSSVTFSGNSRSGELIINNPFKNLINHDKCKK